MKTYSKKEIYNYDSCPICQANSFYLCEVLTDTGEDGLDLPPLLNISPSKFRFTFFETPSYELPWYWAACAECGHVYTKIPNEYFRSKISSWLSGNKIENTTETRCMKCNSENALNWLFGNKGLRRSAVLFNKTPSIKHIFGRYNAIDIEPSCNICLDCGFTFLQIEKSSIVDGGNKRYLRYWRENA